MITVTKRPFDKCFSGNPIHYELSSDTAALDTTIYFEIKIMFGLDQANMGNEVAILPYYPVNGVAQINLQNIIHAHLEGQLPTFEQDETTIQKAVGQIGFTYIEFREIDPMQDAPGWNTSEYNYLVKVLWGGINYFKWQGNNFWVNYLEVKKPFFTWQRSGRLAAPNERMFLMWVNFWFQSLASIVQRIRVTYTDGTTATVEKPFPGGGSFECFYLPAGMQQLSLASLNPGKAINFWEIQVVDLANGGAAYSELFRFTQDNRPNYNSTFLHYRNSIGGFDSVQVRGTIEETLDYNFQEQDRPFKPDYFTGHVITAQKVISQTTETQTFKGDIGYLIKEDQERLRDLQLQRECYMAMGKKWVPVSIITKNFKFRNSNDSVFSMPIEWQLAITGSEFFTPGAVDLGEGVFTSNVCLARIEGLGISINFSAPNLVPSDDVLVTVYGHEVDPQNAAAQFRWRVPQHFDWQTISVGALPFTFQFTRNLARTLEVQAICTNNVYGQTTVKSFDTTEPTTGEVEKNSFIFNHHPTLGFEITLSLAGDTLTSAHLNPGGANPHGFNFNSIGGGQLLINTSGFTPTRVELYNGGAGPYFGSINGSSITWNNPPLTGGFDIHFY